MKVSKIRAPFLQVLRIAPSTCIGGCPDSLPVRWRVPGTQVEEAPISQRLSIGNWTPEALSVRPEVRYYQHPSGSCLGRRPS